MSTLKSYLVKFVQRVYELQQRDKEYADVLRRTSSRKDENETEAPKNLYS